MHLVIAQRVPNGCSAALQGHRGEGVVFAGANDGSGSNNAGGAHVSLFDCFADLKAPYSGRQAFERRDLSAAIDTLKPIAGDLERIRGAARRSTWWRSLC
jgi:hypothetical protein